MAGVIDEYGQWEHCNECGRYVLIQNLGYHKPSKQYPHGRDLCVRCVDKMLRARSVKFGQIVPAKSWKRTLVDRV